MYYIGIDGGGTYSRLVAANEDMRVIGRHTGNSTNLKVYSRETILENIRKLLFEFNRLTNTVISDCVSLCIGGMGVDTEADVSVMSGIFRELGLQGKIVAVSEPEIILATEVKSEPGIVIIANNSSSGFAIDHTKKIYRSGGWGYLLDDVGSSYQIGLEAVRRAIRSYDGRDENTVLPEKICEHLKLKKLEELKELVYSPSFNKLKIAELASVVKAASEGGDKIAQNVEMSAAFELSKIAVSLIQKSKMLTCKIVLSGNTFQFNETIRKTFSAFVAKQYKEVETVVHKGKSEMGALYLALGL